MADEKLEWLKCSMSCTYFLDQYVYIYDATDATWIPFTLWPEQREALKTVEESRLVIILKARQLGMTWLILGYILWLMLFHPAVTALVFSRRDDEASYLLDHRLRGMYQRLPNWMQVKRVLISNSHVWQLSNGSIAYGFPTTAGDSYTASVALVDEADLVPDLGKLLNAVKPTIDGGGKMVLLSRSNKDEPNSRFKMMFQAALRGESPWVPIFLPWYVRPGRDEKWYEDQKNDIQSSTGSLDDLMQQYPATPEEALMARTLDKRIPAEWLQQCFSEMSGTQAQSIADAPDIPGFVIYFRPDPTRPYVIGADPAEGNPTSDDSSAHVLDGLTGEEVACLAEKIEPTVFGGYLAQISEYYNHAPIMVEKNNHGHAVIGYLQENAFVDLIEGWNGDVGWLSSTTGKALLWTIAADAARDTRMALHSRDTLLQLISIEGGTLKAPKGSHDDRAVSYALALAAINTEAYFGFAYSYVANRTAR